MANNIKILWSRPLFFGKEKEYLLDAFESTWISGGYYVKRFEEDFTRYNNSAYGITTSNGTVSLHLAILALGIGRGDEVIVPGFSFVAPVNMVIASGATPIYADIDSESWCIDPASVRECITGKTKAIIAVHTYGNVCDMDSLKEIAKEYNLYIIEDTAEAAFSKYKNKYAGTFGDVGCFSFHAAKTITTGEGGFVLTPSEELCERMRVIRDHGMRKDRRYWHDAIGHNFRLTNLQAAIGCGQLDNLDKILFERQRFYRLYIKYLSNEQGITFQHFGQKIKPVIWTAAVKIDPQFFIGDRDFLIKILSKAGIETRPGFYSFSAMPLYGAPELPVSEDVGQNVICLPSFCALTEDEISFICSQLKKLRK